MTTGSYSRGSVGSVAGLTYPGATCNVKSWTGADRPPLPKQKTFTKKKVWVYLPDKNGKMRNVLRTIRVPDWDGPTGTWRKPKRAYSEPHAYSMSARSAQEFGTTVTTNSCPGSLGSPGSPQLGSVNGLLFRDFGAPSWVSESLIDARLQNEAINRLSVKVSGSSFNMAITAAELPEAISMITGSAIRIAKAVYHVRRGDISGASQALVSGTDRRPIRQHRPGTNAHRKAAAKDVSGNWLELQYGWLPLLSDIVDGAKMLAHQLNVPRVQVYRSSVWTTRTTRYNFSRTWMTNCTPIQSTLLSGYSEGFKKSRITIIGRISEHPSIPQLLGVTDPLSVAWEILPFSFVADWFLPIGDYLQARANASKLVGTFIQTIKNTGLRKVPVLTDMKTVIHGDPEPWSDTVMVRSISTTLKPEMPSFIPLDSALSWKRMVSATSLMVQAFTK